MPYIISDEPTPTQPDTKQGRFIVSDTLPNPDSTGKWIYQKVVAPTIEGAGMIAGGLAGSAVTPIAGTVGGAALGYAGARSLTKGIESLLGYSTPETIPEAFKRAGQDVISGTAMEMGGQVGGKIIGSAIDKIAAPWANRITSKTTEAISKSAEEDIPLSAADITRSRSQALAENVLSNAPLSAGMVQRFKLNQLQKLTEYRNRLISENGSPDTIENIGLQVKSSIDDFIKKTGLIKDARVDAIRNDLLKKIGSTDTYEELGISLQKAIADKSKIMMTKGSELFNRVGELVPQGAIVETPILKSKASDLLAEQMKLPQSQRNSGIINLLQDLKTGQINKPTSEVSTLIDPISMKPYPATNVTQTVKGYDWGTAQAIRSDLGSKIAEQDAAFKMQQPGMKFLSNNEGGIYKQLRSALNNDMESFANKSGGDIKDAFDVANSFYKEGKQLFNKTDMFRVLKSNPERVVDMIIRPGGISEIKMIKDAVGESGFQPLKNKFQEQLIANSNDANGVFSGDKLLKNLASYGDETLLQVFKKPELDALRNIATGAKHIQNTPDVNKFYVNLVKSLDKQPENIANIIIRPDNTRNILLTKKVLGDKGWADVKAKFFEQLLTEDKEIAGITGSIVSPQRVLTRINKYSDNTLNKVFNPIEFQKIKDFKLMAEYVQGAEKIAGNPSGTAQNVIAWAQGALLLHNPLTGSMSVITPYMLGKLYFQPGISKYLTTGLKTPAGTKAGIELATKLITLMNLQNKRSENVRP